MIIQRPTRFTSPRLRGEVAAQRRVRGSPTRQSKLLPLTPTLSSCWKHASGMTLAGRGRMEITSC
jgi:hypothetical protein